MCGLFFDDDGDVGISIGDNFGVNTRTGKTSFIIGFDDEDDE